MGKVGITETICRDAHQSLIATRMTTEEMLPALPLMDKAGYHALEVWGGATFDACLRFLNEDPWERLRKIRAAAPNSKLQMLFRGQNVHRLHRHRRRLRGTRPDARPRAENGAGPQPCRNRHAVLPFMVPAHARGRACSRGSPCRRVRRAKCG